MVDGPDARVTAYAGPRSCARPPGAPAVTPTAVTRSTRSYRPLSPTGCPAGSTLCRLPLCCARGSPATGHCGGPPATGRAPRAPRHRRQRASARTVVAGRGRHRARPDPGSVRTETGAETGSRVGAVLRGMPPEPLDSPILFAPVDDPAPWRCGPSTGAGRRPSPGPASATPPALHYGSGLFREKEVRSVTSDTREGGRESLAPAARYGVHASTHVSVAGGRPGAAGSAGGRSDGAAVLVHDLSRGARGHS